MSEQKVAVLMAQKGGRFEGFVACDCSAHRLKDRYRVLLEKKMPTGCKPYGKVFYAIIPGGK